jgi:hypothetical protein
MSFTPQAADIVEEETLNLLVAADIEQRKREELLLLLDEKLNLIRKRLRDLIPESEANLKLSILQPKLRVAFKQYKRANKRLSKHILFANSLLYLSHFF